MGPGTPELPADRVTSAALAPLAPPDPTPPTLAFATAAGGLDVADAVADELANAFSENPNPRLRLTTAAVVVQHGGGAHAPRHRPRHRVRSGVRGHTPGSWSSPGSRRRSCVRPRRPHHPKGRTWRPRGAHSSRRPSIWFQQLFPLQCLLTPYNNRASRFIALFIEKSPMTTFVAESRLRFGPQADTHLRGATFASRPGWATLSHVRRSSP